MVVGDFKIKNSLHTGQYWNLCSLPSSACETIKFLLLREQFVSHFHDPSRIPMCICKANGNMVQ